MSAKNQTQKINKTEIIKWFIVFAFFAALVGAIWHNM